MLLDNSNQHEPLDSDRIICFMPFGKKNVSFVTQENFQLT